MAVHVRCKSLYISIPSSAYCEERERQRLIFLYFHLEFNVGITCYACASSGTDIRILEI